MLTNFRIALGIALVGLPGPVWGNRYCDPTDPENCVQAVAEGHVAPFSGVILTHQRAARLAAAQERCEALREMDLAEAEELFQIKLNLLEDKAKNDLAAVQLQNDLLRQQVAEAAVPWYEEPIFVVVVTVAVTSLFYFGAVKAIEATASR